jgi:hypothetical protein
MDIEDLTDEANDPALALIRELERMAEHAGFDDEAEDEKQAEPAHAAN